MLLFMLKKGKSKTVGIKSILLTQYRNIFLYENKGTLDNNKHILSLSY